MGSARLGAGGGGVIIVAVGFAIATLLMLHKWPTRRAIASPLVALVAHAILDFANAATRPFNPRCTLY